MSSCIKCLPGVDFSFHLVSLFLTESLSPHSRGLQGRAATSVSVAPDLSSERGTCCPLGPGRSLSSAQVGQRPHPLRLQGTLGPGALSFAAAADGSLVLLHHAWLLLAATLLLGVASTRCGKYEH